MRIGNPHEYFKKLDAEVIEHLNNVSGGIEKLLDRNDLFQFSCIQQNTCCTNRDTHPIIVSPYDAYVMRKSLNYSSTEFNNKHGKLLLGDKSQYPLMILRNRPTDRNNTVCEFLRPEGCGIYEARPTVCRMYPVGRLGAPDGTSYFFLVNTKECCNAGQGKIHTLSSWLKDTKTDKYIDWNDKFQSLIFDMDRDKYLASPDKFKFFLGEVLYNYDKVKDIPQIQPLVQMIKNESDDEIEQIYQLARTYTKAMF